MTAQRKLQSLQIEEEKTLQLPLFNQIYLNLIADLHSCTKSRSTLETRLQGVHARSATTPVNRKLSSVEEESLVQWILDLDRRRFPPYIIDVRRMADALLAARGQILFLSLWARTGQHALSQAQRSSRQSGIGNSTHKGQSVRILSRSAQRVVQACG